MTLSRSNVLGSLAAVLVGGMHIWGAYERYFWFDNIAHVLGGVMVGGFLYDDDARASYVLGATLGVAALWEGFEAVRGVRPWAGEKSYDDAAEDTILDTLLVLFGAAYAYVASRPSSSGSGTRDPRGSTGEEARL